MAFGLFVALTLAGCGGVESAPPEAKPPQVDVSVPVKGTLTEYEVFTGRTEALYSANLQAQVTGYLKKAPFEQGDDVKKGDVLFEIDPRPFQATYDADKALVAQNEANLELAKQNNDRAQTLGSQKSSAIAQAEVDQYRSQLAQAIATLNQSKANLETAQLNLEWAVIRAPFDGRVSRRLVDPGNLVMANNTILASLVELDRLYAYFDVDERTLLRINEHLPSGKVPADSAQKLPVTLGLANEKPEAFSHLGTLKFTDNKVDPTTGTLRMWGTFENEKLDLKPGLFVRVRLGVGEPRPALFVAESALGSDQGRRYLYVVDKENKIVYTPVDVGQRKDVVVEGKKRTLIAVTGHEGYELKGKRVVVNGLQRVRPGDKVESKLVTMPGPEVKAEAAPKHATN